MPEDKEVMEFLTRFLGGTASALTENAFVYYAQMHPELFGQFPYNRPMEQLPYWYRIIVGGISIGEALLGLGIEEDPMKVIPAASKAAAQEFGRGLRKFGEGGVLYTAPMLTSRTIVKNIPPGTVGTKGQGKKTPPAARRGIVVKL